jgi:hypothetical protein
MDVPERVNDGYSNKDIRTVDLLVSIVLENRANGVEAAVYLTV